MSHRALAFGALLLGASLVQLTTARSPVSQAAPEYVGSETCKQCHQEQWEKFQTNPHHRAEMDPSVVAEHVGCEGCHGPGSLHVGAGGDSTDAGFHTIRNFRKISADEVVRTCRGCHAGGEQMYWDHSTHAKNGVGCLQCHSIHHSQTDAEAALLKTRDVNQLCISCHKDKRTAMARSAHMPLREGSMTCADCHNPHGAPSEHMIRAATTNDLCYKCHADKRGPFLWDHAPVREDCLNCHQPHGSNNDKVLASRRPYLCQRCHIPTRHPSVSYDARDLASNRLFNRSCTNCHSQIHGSNHPSGRYFLR
jgi:DmsE family decaheme c-type cytochrome